MKEKKTKQQKKEEREARYNERRIRDIERHTVPCPHCGKGVLDHMTKCPFCGGEITSTGYYSTDEKKKKTVKVVCYAVLIALAIAVVLIVTFVKR